MDANKIIDDFGGTGAVADIFMVTTGAVSQWRSSGIPKARLMYLRLLRPDLFSDTPKDPPQDVRPLPDRASKKAA